jgi:hypothetical protein
MLGPHGGALVHLNIIVKQDVIQGISHWTAFYELALTDWSV